VLEEGEEEEILLFGGAMEGEGEEEFVFLGGWVEDEDDEEFLFSGGREDEEAEAESLEEEIFFIWEERGMIVVVEVREGHLLLCL
jgi:hypothetical protein